MNRVGLGGPSRGGAERCFNVLVQLLEIFYADIFSDDFAFFVEKQCGGGCVDVAPACGNGAVIIVGEYEGQLLGLGKFGDSRRTVMAHGNRNGAQPLLGIGVVGFDHVWHFAATVDAGGAPEMQEGGVALNVCQCFWGAIEQVEVLSRVTAILTDKEESAGCGQNKRQYACNESSFFSRHGW